MIVYCFRQNANGISGEYHIESCEKYLGQDDKYYIRKINTESECGERLDSFSREDEHFNPLKNKNQKYFSEKEMRYACASLGRCVCGQCVATLYTTY